MQSYTVGLYTNVVGLYPIHVDVGLHSSTHVCRHGSRPIGLVLVKWGRGGSSPTLPPSRAVVEV